MKKQLMMTSSTLDTVVNLIEIMKLEARKDPVLKDPVLADGNLPAVEERNPHPDGDRINLNEIKRTGHAVFSEKIIFLKIVKKFGRFVKSLYFYIVKLKGK